MSKSCTLCGGVGHSVSECPWTKRFQVNDGPLPDPVTVVTDAPLRAQSKLSSLVESLANTFLGLLIAMGATAVICWAHGIPMSWSNNFIITSWMTLLSVARGYVLRRMWNAEFWKSWLARWRHRKIDPDLCCCGSRMGQGGSICHHGGCRSAKEYAITRELGGK